MELIRTILHILQFFFSALSNHKKLITRRKTKFFIFQDGEMIFSFKFFILMK